MNSSTGHHHLDTSKPSPDLNSSRSFPDSPLSPSSTTSTVLIHERDPPQAQAQSQSQAQAQAQAHAQAQGHPRSGERNRERGRLNGLKIELEHDLFDDHRDPYGPRFLEHQDRERGRDRDREEEEIKTIGLFSHQSSYSHNHQQPPPTHNHNHDVHNHIAHNQSTTPTPTPSTAQTHLTHATHASTDAYPLTPSPSTVGEFELSPVVRYPPTRTGFGRYFSTGEGSSHPHPHSHSHGQAQAEGPFTTMIDRPKDSISMAIGMGGDSPATTPTSASHELFHAVSTKVSTLDQEAMERAVRSGLGSAGLDGAGAVAPGSGPAGPGPNPVPPPNGPLPKDPGTTVPPPLGMTWQPPGTGKKFGKGDILSPLPLVGSGGTGGGTGGGAVSSRRSGPRDQSPPRRSPLNQVIAFEEAQREWYDQQVSQQALAARGTLMVAPNGHLPSSGSGSGSGSGLGSGLGSGSGLGPGNRQAAFTNRQEMSIEEEMLDSPRGSSPASPFNPRPGFTTFSPRARGGFGSTQTGGAASMRGAGNGVGSTLGTGMGTGQPQHSRSHPDFSNLASHHRAEDAHEGDQDDLNPDTASIRRPTTLLSKPALQRAWSDGSERTGLVRKEPAGNRMYGYEEGREGEGKRTGSERGGDSSGRAMDDRLIREEASIDINFTAADYVIAVIGRPGVGKSTIIRKAFKTWGLDEPCSIGREDPERRVLSYSARVETGQPPRMRIVQILEIDLQALQVDEGKGHAWPGALVRVDGAMICYDALDGRSIAGLAEVISDLCSTIPAMVVACKSDPEEDFGVQPLEGNEIGAPFNIGLVELSIHMSQGKHKMRMSFGWLLKAISKERRSAPQVETVAHGPARDREHPSPGEQQQGPWQPISRQLSEEGRQVGQETVIRRVQSSGAVRSLESSAVPSQSGPVQPQLSPEDQPEVKEQLLAPVGPEKDESSDMPVTAQTEGIRREKPPPISVVTTRLDDSKLPTSPSQSSKFVTFDAVSVQLLRAILTGSDNTFVNAFFLTYRRFSEPPDVMNKLYGKWIEISNSSSMSASSRQWAFSRLLLAVVEWVRVYPGDFAFTEARETLIKLYRGALGKAYLGHLSADLADSIAKLETVRDLDESWSFAARMSKKAKSLAPPTTGDSNTPQSSGVSPYSDLDDTTLEAMAGQKAAEAGRSQPVIRAPSIMSTSTKESAYAVVTPDPGRPSVSSPPMSMSSGFVNSYTSYPISRMETKPHRASSDGSRSVSEAESEGSRPFLRSLTLLEGLSDLAVAVELSKEEWRLFSQLRPRDCLKQVMGGEKHSAIGQCVAHFNDISAWVATLVLGHSRSRNRAKIYERFCAVCVHLLRRLAQTRQAVRPMYEQDLKSCLELVNPQGSYNAYRTALKEDGLLGNKAIPFLGVVTQDLTKVHAVNTSDKDEYDAIHWKKYEVIADALGPISLYQSRQNPFATLPGSSAARQMILDCPRLDEDGLYDRSKHLEPDIQMQSSSMLGGKMGAAQRSFNQGWGMPRGTNYNDTFTRDTNFWASAI